MHGHGERLAAVLRARGRGIAGRLTPWLVMIAPVLGQPVYVRTDPNYSCECAVCADPTTRRIETRKFIESMLRASFELCVPACSYGGLSFFSCSMVCVSEKILRLVSITDYRTQSRPHRVHTLGNSSRNPPPPSISNLIQILTHPSLSRKDLFHSDIQVHRCRRLIWSRSVITAGGPRPRGPDAVRPAGPRIVDRLPVCLCLAGPGYRLSGQATRSQSPGGGDHATK